MTEMLKESKMILEHKGKSTLTGDVDLKILIGSTHSGLKFLMGTHFPQSTTTPKSKYL